MTKKNKTLMILGILLLALLLAVCMVLYGFFATNNMKMQQQIGEYLEVFEERAITHLRENEEFVAAYGSDSDLDAISWSYGYTDPQKYPTFTFKPNYPATFELFEAELKQIQVSFELPDRRTCAVRFEKNPEGELELVGWEYADEDEE